MSFEESFNLILFGLAINGIIKTPAVNMDKGAIIKRKDSRFI